MFNKTRKAAVMTLLCGALILSACAGGGAEETPTTDPNIIFTSAAITVQAQLTEIARLTPQATQTPASTNTSMPTATPSTPFPTFAPLASNTPAPAGGGVVSTGDKCEYVSQVPEDDTEIYPGVKFDMIWTLKNTGTTTWTTQYSYRKYSGSGLSDKSSYPFTKTVAPNESIDITVDMTGPSKETKYTEVWVLTNVEGRNFCTFTVQLDVDKGAATPVGGSGDDADNEDYWYIWDVVEGETCASIADELQTTVDESIDEGDIQDWNDLSDTECETLEAGTDIWYFTKEDVL